MVEPLIFDGDYPMAYSARALHRDLTRPLAELQRQEEVAGKAAVATATLPEMRRAGIAVALAKLVGRIERPESPLAGCACRHAAYAAAMADLAYYRSLERAGEITILTTASALAAHLARWQAATESAGLPVGLILGLEGADPIQDPAQLPDWWQAGLRVVSLTHYGPSAYAHGTGTPGGLLPPAPALLEAMAECGVMLDLTHISDEGFWQTVEIFTGPVLASHQNCRALCAGERQFSDDQLRLIIARDGVIGVAMDTWMLYAAADLDWRLAGTLARRQVFPRAAVTLAHLADHIDHICQLAGNARHAAIGADTDGQGGIDGTPDEVRSVVDYRRLLPILAGRGYSEAQIAGIFYGNWARFYGRCLPPC